MINNENKLKVVVKSQKYSDKALELSKKTEAEIVSESDIESDDLVIVFDEDGVSLKKGELILRADFEKMIPRLKKASQSTELLIKASKIKGKQNGLMAIDATAGLGEDSLILAYSGFSVRMYEYDPVIAALLTDAVERAADNPFLRESALRMSVYNENSIDVMNSVAEDIDVILLDPMFPERQKSALIGKKFQLLQRLESPCNNERELIDAAFKARPRKVVIKRPIKGQCLAGIKPEYVISGKAVRYDCFTFSKS